MRLIPFLLTLLIAASSCAPTLYAPPQQHITLLEKKGDAQVEFNIPMVSETAFFPTLAGVQVAGAYAISDEWGIAAQYQYLGGDNIEFNVFDSLGNIIDDGILGWETRIHYTQAAGVYFNQFSRLGYLEVMGGLGYGRALNGNFRDANDSFLNGNFMKPFIQPSIGLNYKNVAFLFTPRISTLHFFNVTTQIPGSSINFPKSKTEFAFEPGLTLAVGGPYVKVMTQLNVSILDFDPFTNNEIFSDAVYQRVSISFGFRGRIPSKKEKKRSD